MFVKIRRRRSSAMAKARATHEHNEEARARARGGEARAHVRTASAAQAALTSDALEGEAEPRAVQRAALTQLAELHVLGRQEVLAACTGRKRGSDGRAGGSATAGLRGGAAPCSCCCASSRCCSSWFASRCCSGGSAPSCTVSCSSSRRRASFCSRSATDSALAAEGRHWVTGPPTGSGGQGRDERASVLRGRGLRC